MTAPWRRLAPSLVRTTAAAALAVGSLTVVTGLPAQAADPVTIQILGINDFHGRIDDEITPEFATTIERARLADGANGANTALVGAGDLIGASLFASASAQDNPTIDVLNALGLDASAVGNHEFDQGFDDLVNRVIPAANWKYLGANVYDKGTQDPALDESYIIDVNGVKVGVVGAVTDETPTLVSPEGVADLDFGDPVDAVNRAAAAIDDQVDVTVATFHEGAASGATYDEAVAAGGKFAEIVQETDSSVDVIFTGHTHRAYAFNAPIPGVAGKTRPVLQTGQYADNVGKVTVTVDPDTDEVSATTMVNVPRVAIGDVDDDNPVVQEVTEITDAAEAAAAEVGNRPIGKVTAAIARPLLANGADDRTAESALGNLVANALRDSLTSTQGGADIGLVNPGGLRAPLDYAGNTADNAANTDGVVTYAEANAVLPFVNNLWTITLTGAELKQVLEQQWQPTGASRPFLHLGLSDNMSTTLDPSQPVGSRVTSVVINGEPLDPAKEYKVATFSFLGTGGDNFTAFTQGTSVDSGLVDRDAWIAYLGAQSPVSPSYARRQVYATGIPETVVADQDVSFDLTKLNLAGVTSVPNTDLDVWLRPADGGKRVFIDTYEVEAANDGSASVAFTAPNDLVGDYTVVAMAKPSGTTVGIGQQASAVTAAKVKAIYGKAATVNITTTPASAGTVKVYKGATLLGTGMVTAGTATVKLGRTALRPGSHTLTLRYSGDDADVAASEGTVAVSVAKGSTTTNAVKKTATVKAKKTNAKVRVTVKAPGFVPAGQVEIRFHGTAIGAGKLKDGQVTLTIEKFRTTGKKTLVAKYLGNALAKGSRDTFTIRVVK